MVIQHVGASACLEENAEGEFPAEGSDHGAAKPFLVCVHDASPVWEVGIRRMLRELAPLVGRRLVLGVVPDWDGLWPLAAHRGFCELLRASSEELLLHGYRHRRSTGRGPVSLLTGGADEMNGLSAEETRRTLERGQRVFEDMFGARARGFLAPAWQAGRVRPGAQVDHVLGFFSIASRTGRRVRLATFSWDCGRWGWLGHAGHATGALLRTVPGRVPVLAIHPADFGRGFWLRTMRLTGSLLDTGYEPVTAARLLGTRGC